jgi:hypothetical protein
MTSTDKAREPRGSQKMLEQLSKNGATPSSEEVLKALDLPAGVKVQNWHTRGIPPRSCIWKQRCRRRFRNWAPWWTDW